MQKTLKNTFYDEFTKTCLENNKYNLTEAQIRHYTYFLAYNATLIHDENYTKMNELYHENAIIMEKSRAQFHDMVLYIEKTTGIIVENLKSMGMLRKEYDKAGKCVVKGKTTVVTDMVDYLNKLNELVIKFYQEVYQIEKEQGNKGDNSFVQGYLF